jgi:hypothetical protein
MQTAADRRRIDAMRGDLETKQAADAAMRGKTLSTLFGGYFNRDELSHTAKQMAKADQSLKEAREAVKISEEQIKKLLSLLTSVPLLRDGVVTNLDLSDADAAGGSDV